ncbi:MAG: hypothetical protein AAB512_05410 [Patescibacteria group bacterium]
MADLEGRGGSRLLAEIQSRFRSDRFSTVGDRFKGVHAQLNPEARRERELNRLRILEERRVTSMYQHLADDTGLTVDDIKFVMGATDEPPKKLDQ